MDLKDIYIQLLNTQLHHNQACCQTNLYILGFWNTKGSLCAQPDEVISTLAIVLMATQDGDFYDDILSGSYNAG